MRSVVDEKRINAIVTEITWERIFLHIDVQIDVLDKRVDLSQLVFYAVNGYYKAKTRFKVTGIDGNVIHLVTNVTNNGENRCLPTGTYQIYICQGEEKLASCDTIPEVVEKLDALSRNFLYGAKNSVYAVTFFVAEDEDTLPFRFHVLASTKDVMDFPEYNNFFKELHILKNLKLAIGGKRKFLDRVYRIEHFLFRRKRENTILFMSEQNESIASNLKAVSDRMKERGLDKEYNMLFSNRAAAAMSQSKFSWFSVIKKLAQSGIVVIDDHAPVLDWLHLAEDTKVVQLWHAGAGFKSSGYSRWGHLGCPSPVSCHRQYAFGIAGSKNIAPFFSEVWGINDEQVLPTGMPRMDEFLDAGYREKTTRDLYEKYPMAKGKKVILFAPTYRGKNKKNAYYPYEKIDFEKLYQLCGDEYVVFFKMHPWVSQAVPIKKKYSDKFIDVGKYPKINDLFYITELLITDYSSNIFEYSLMRKPMLFFAYDKTQYSLSRGFHRAYEESAPGKVCYTFEEVLTAIQNKDFEYEKVEEYVEHHFDYIDSNASDRVIDWIIRGELPEDIRNDLARKEQQNLYIQELNFHPELIGEAVPSQE